MNRSGARLFVVVAIVAMTQACGNDYLCDGGVTELDVVFSVVDASTGKQICDATIIPSADAPVPDTFDAGACLYGEVASDDSANLFTVTHPGYEDQSFRIPRDYCRHVTGHGPGRIALVRHTGG